MACEESNKSNFFNLPDAPQATPVLSAWDRFLCRVLPRVVHPYWKLELLYVIRLNDFVTPPERNSIKIDWLEDLRNATGEQIEYMSEHIGRIGWWFWQRRLNHRNCWLGLASMDGQIVHYTFVLPSGKPPFNRYASIAHKNSAAVGPCYTSQAARGKGIFPYVVSRAFDLLKHRGFSWGYISVRIENAASMKGIRKIPGVAEAARLLYRRSALCTSRLCGVTVLAPEAVR